MSQLINTTRCTVCTDLQVCIVNDLQVVCLYCMYVLYLVLHFYTYRITLWIIMVLTLFGKHHHLASMCCAGMGFAAIQVGSASMPIV